MRTKEEVQKMLRLAVNATHWMKYKTKQQREIKDKMYCFIQALTWVLEEDDDFLTARFEERIETLKNNEE